MVAKSGIHPPYIMASSLSGGCLRAWVNSDLEGIPEIGIVGVVPCPYIKLVRVEKAHKLWRSQKARAQTLTGKINQLPQ